MVANKATKFTDKQDVRARDRLSSPLTPDHEARPILLPRFTTDDAMQERHQGLDR